MAFKSVSSAFFGFIFIVLQLCYSNVALSKTVTINAIDSGWYVDDGGRSSAAEYNISAGVCPGCPYKREMRNFFLFDLSSVTQTIVSAELRISTGNTETSFGRLVTDDTFETFSLFDVTDESMLSVGDPGNTAMFDDLATGSNYGSYTFNSQTGIFNSPVDLYISMNLTSDAIYDINNTNSLFGIGGTIVSLDNDLSRTQYAFSGTHRGPQIRELILTTVPLPTAFWLFGSGLLGLIGVASRKKE